LKTKRKKSKTNLADLEAILEILESWSAKLISPLDKGGKTLRSLVAKERYAQPLRPLTSWWVATSPTVI
jgi:hypothetical protein